MTAATAPGREPAGRLIVFAREPRLGEVKTRLAATLGAAKALEAYGQLLEATLSAARDCHGVERWLCLAAASDSPRAGPMVAAEDFHLAWQVEGDLGARMAQALREAVRSGAPAVLVGCDCPPLDAGVMAAAFEALADVDFVFGPTEDGGYALVGARIDLPAAFENIDWGTPRVMIQTRQRLARAGIAWRELAPLWDVDDESDWRRWQRWRTQHRAASG